jgi:hypothetical protein
VAQDLALAGGELVELRVDLLGRDVAGERVQHEPGEPRREDRVALADAADGVGEVGAGDRLRHVAAGAGADDRDDVVGVVADREREEALLGAPLGGLLDHLDAAATGHVDVEEDDVGLALGDLADGVLDGLGLAEDLDQVTELGLHPGAEDPVVVDDDDGRRLLAHLSASIVSSTSVPLPGALRTSALPP